MAWWHLKPTPEPLRSRQLAALWLLTAVGFAAMAWLGGHLPLWLGAVAAVIASVTHLIRARQPSRR